MHATPRATVTAGPGGCLRRYGGRPQPLARLVCFPWCGAGASVYRRFASTLPDHIDLLAVQLPGREDRFGEHRLLRMGAIVDHVLGSIVSVFDRPLFLFGHSMGAIIAYEVALALRARIGREPDGLIVSGQNAPGCRPLPDRCWHTAEEDALIANIRELGGTPPEILADRDVMRALLPLLKADYEVLETYSPGADRPLSRLLIACAGEEDREVTREGVGAWTSLTSGPSGVHWFGGDHFYLCSQPAVLTGRLREWVAPGVRPGAARVGHPLP